MVTPRVVSFRGFLEALLGDTIVTQRSGEA
jgi:hypothetical protein